MIDPRAVAIQGIGVGARPTALQGLVPMAADDPDDYAPFSGRPIKQAKEHVHRDTDDDLLLFIL